MENERVFEINGNLGNILNYNNFEKTICQIRNRFVELFGTEVMSRIPVYVDNATDRMSGYTPIITPIFGKYLCIKLNIDNFLKTEKIIYQFAHELCHYVFYSLLGLDRPFANEREESICTAMSLCVLKDFGIDIELRKGNIESWVEYVSNLDNIGYRNGADVAEGVNYNSDKLSLIILKETRNGRN